MSESTGLPQGEYEQIYGPRSRYVLPIVSAAYPTRDWTQLELGYAKQEAARRDSEFILPVRLDDTIVLGLPDDLNYVSLVDHTAEQIASALEQKILESDIGSAGAVSNQDTDAVALLSAEVRGIANLIAVAIWPLSEKTYRELFPTLRWTHTLRKLRATTVLTTDSERVELSKPARSAILSETADTAQAHDQWVEALQDRRGHVDLACLLGYHYLATDRHEEAARVLARMAGSGDLGNWSELYLDVLETYTGSRHWRKFAGDLRCEVLNAISRCHTSLGSTEAARRTLTRLLTFSRRSENNYWTGQTLLNLGARAAQEGDISTARNWYKRAVEHGEKHTDRQLLGRVLGNQSQLEIDNNPAAAQRLLAQSLKHKKAAKDRSGVAVASAQAGTIAARAGDYVNAVTHYRKACSMMRELGMEHEHATTLIHLAQALLDLGKSKSAIPELDASIEIATVWSYDSIHRLALERLAQAYFDVKNWAACRDACEKLLALARGIDAESHVCARHGLAMLAFNESDRTQGLRHLKAAITVSDRAGLREWSVRCRVDRSRGKTADGLGEPGVKRLLRDARKLEKKSQFLLAADLLNWTGEHCIYNESCESEAVHLLTEASRLYGLAGESEDAVLAMARTAEASDRQGDFADALFKLEEAERRAKSQGLQKLYGQIMDQRGTLLLDLQRGDEAIEALEDALALAKEGNDTARVVHSLHNLGEACRRCGNFAKATQSLELAEETASASGDIEGAIDSRHSRALVEQHQERFREASTLLQSCRRDAEKHSLWGEYVRAWEAMANLAWHRGDGPAAEKRYARALDEAVQRNEFDSVDRIALNYASLLHHRDKSKKAKRVLAAHTKQFCRRRNAYLYHAKLGAIAFECGDLDLALQQCRLGIKSADAAKNREYQATCRGFLGEILVSTNRYTEAVQHLEEAIDFEEVVEDEVQLRYALIDAYLGCGRDEEVQAVYDELIRLAHVSEMWPSLVDVHMLLFDHSWAHGWEGRLNAMQAYTMAFTHAIEGELYEEVAHIALHLVMTLTSQKRPLSASKLAGIRSKLDKWIKDSASDPDSLGDPILTLMEIAEDLQQYVGRPRVLERESYRLLMDFWRRYDVAED